MEATGIKERFTPDEWHQLKLLPILVFNFTFLRLANERPQDVDTQLARTFITSITAAKPTEPMFRELIEDTPQAELNDLIPEATGSDILALVEPLERIAGVLSRELSRKDYNTFLAAVVSACGLLPFQGLSEEANDVTMRAWRDLGKVFGIDWQTALRSLRAQERASS